MRFDNFVFYLENAEHIVKFGSSGGGHNLVVKRYVLSAVARHKLPSVFSRSFNFLKLTKELSCEP